LFYVYIYNKLMLFLLLVQIVYSGLIETLDYSINYLNIGYTT